MRRSTCFILFLSLCAAVKWRQFDIQTGPFLKTDVVVGLTCNTTELLLEGSVRQDGRDLRFQSGMDEGAEILPHVIYSGWNSSNTVFLVGFSTLPAASSVRVYMRIGGSEKKTEEKKTLKWKKVVVNDNNPFNVLDEADEIVIDESGLTAPADSCLTLTAQVIVVLGNIRGDGKSTKVKDFSRDTSLFSAAPGGSYAGRGGSYKDMSAPLPQSDVNNVTSGSRGGGFEGGNGGGCIYMISAAVIFSPNSVVNVSGRYGVTGGGGSGGGLYISARAISSYKSTSLVSRGGVGSEVQGEVSGGGGGGRIIVRTDTIIGDMMSMDAEGAGTGGSGDVQISGYQVYENSVMPYMESSQLVANGSESSAIGTTVILLSIAVGILGTIVIALIIAAVFLIRRKKKLQPTQTIEMAQQH